MSVNFHYVPNYGLITSTIGLGFVLVSSANLVPKPPASITHFKVFYDIFIIEVPRYCILRPFLKLIL